MTMSISIKLTAEVRVYPELLILWVRTMPFHGHVKGTWLLSEPFTRPIMNKVYLSCQLITENAAGKHKLRKELDSKYVFALPADT